jgi:hypothetical protein
MQAITQNLVSLKPKSRDPRFDQGQCGNPAIKEIGDGVAKRRVQHTLYLPGFDPMGLQGIVQQDFHRIVGEGANALAAQIIHRQARLPHQRHAELAAATYDAQWIGPCMIHERLRETRRAKLGLAAP